MAIQFLHDVDINGNLDLKNNELQNAKLQQLATNPSPVVEGMIFQNTTSDVVIVGLNGSWVPLTSADGDITAVTAGNGLTGGGGTGSVTLNVVGGNGITADAGEILLTNGLIADGSNITSLGNLTALNVDNISINGSAISSSAAANLSINVADGQSVIIEGVDIDDGVVTGASSITSTAFVGNVTGNVTGNTSGTALTVTQAAQTAITSVGTLTALQVDNININGNTISSTAGTDLNITPLAGQQIVLDGTIVIDAGVVTGATSITSTAFVGALTGNASTATKIASITNADIVQLDATQTLTNKTIAASQVTEISNLTADEGAQLENIGATTITATQWGYLGAATGAITNTDNETTTVLSLPGGNILRYVDEDGTTTDLSLSAYLDDTNLARLTSGALNGSTGLATFTRDDASTFTIDMSDLLDAITLNNTLTSTSTSEGLTAAQGKVLKDLIDAFVTSTGSNSGDEPDASVTVKGIVELATTDEALTGTDTARAVTAAGLSARSYTATIGDGSATSIAVDHNLGTRAVIVQMFDTSSYETVYAQVVRTTAARVTVDFNTAPATNDITIMVTKVQ
jgi:hypothetical protein